MTLETAIKRYLEWKATYTTKAVISYRLSLYRFKNLIDDKPLEEITLEDVIKYQHWMKPKFALSNVRYSMLVIKNFLDFWLRQGIKSLAGKASIKKKISPHSFRHAKAHRILRLGGNVKEIQAVLRHSENNPAASFNYLKLSDSEFEEVAGEYL